MPLFQSLRPRRPSFRSSVKSSMKSMPSMSGMPSLDRQLIEQQIEQAVERGRARIEAVADSLSSERVAELIEEMRDEAAPYIERAIPILERAARRPVRKTHGKRNAALIVLGLAVIGGVLAYLFWQRRDEEPAYLMDAPPEPHVAPTAMPPSSTPSGGPSAPSPADGPVAPHAEDGHRAMPLDARSDRELTGAGREERPFAPPSFSSRTSAPFVTSRDQLPEITHRPWLPR